MMVWVLAPLSVIAIFIFLLAPVFSGDHILPQAFRIGPVLVHYYGITMALAVLSGYVLAIRRAKLYALSENFVDSMIFYAIVGGFIGARLYHVASSWQYYIVHPLESVKVWNGGLSIFGALFGGLVAAILVYRLYPWKSTIKPSFMQLLDWGAPSFVLGQILGRFGNLFNYEAYGYPTTLPWKMFVPPQFRLDGVTSSSFFHPLFLYEQIGNILIFILLIRLARKNAYQERFGTLFFLYLFLYNTLRFFLEFLRVDSTFIGFIRLNTVTSFVLLCIGAVGLYFLRKRKQVA